MFVELSTVVVSVIVVVLVVATLGGMLWIATTGFNDLRVRERGLREENESLKKEVQALNIDRETGAVRKDLFMEKAQALLHRAVHEKVWPYGFMYFDVDGLKRVNDHLGHHMGDELIKLVACAIRKHIRPNDIFGRMGGDEFAVPLIDLNRSSGQITMARMRAITEEIRQEIAVDQRFANLGVGVSVGCFIGDSRDTPIVEAMKIADAEMLRDKKARHIVRGFSEGNGTDEKKD